MKEDVHVLSDELIVAAPCTIGSPKDGFIGLGTSEFSVFLCPDCDKVHLHFASPELNNGELQFNAALEQEQVDKLVALLVAPRVAY